jgi:hypothetical protein
MRPEKFSVLVSAFEGKVDDRDWLIRAAEFGAEHRRLPRLGRAERASTGRAHCRMCRDLIPKGVFRLALQMFEEGRMSPIGYIHVACAEAYFGTRDIFDRVCRLTPDLSEEEAREIETTLRDASPAAEAELRLAKTRPPAESETLDAASGDRSNGTGHV